MSKSLNRRSAFILTALAALVVATDDHWTEDGLPRVDAVSKLSGIEDLSRQDITDAAPAFSRANPVLPEGAAVAPGPLVDEDDPDEALAKAREALEAAQTAMREAQARADAVVRAKAAEEASVPVTSHIKQYLESQKAMQQERADTQRRLAEQGLANIHNLLPRPAPLDSAHARKRGFGMQRPAPRLPQQ